MQKVIKVLIYTFLLFSMMLLSSVLEMKITTPEYNYSVIVESNKEEEIAEFATNNNIDIYQNYCLLPFAETPYYFNLNGDDFYKSSPIIDYQNHCGTYYINATSSEIFEFEEFMLDNNIVYDLSEPFAHTTPELKISHLSYLFVSLLLLIVFTKYYVYKKNKTIYLKQINGYKSYKIFSDLCYSSSNIIVAIVICLVIFPIVNGYFSLFMFLATIICLIIMLSIEFIVFAIFSNEKKKISLVTLIICFTLIPLMCYFTLYNSQSYKYQLARVHVLVEYYEIYNDYYYVPGGIVMEPTETNMLFIEGSDAEMLYYFGISHTNEKEPYPMLSINRDFLVDQGYNGIIYDFYIPEGNDFEVPEGYTYKYYDPGLVKLEIPPILTTMNQVDSSPLPFFIDEEFDYTQYQSDGTTFLYVYPADSYAKYQLLRISISFVKFLLNIFFIIFLIITVIYIFTAHFLDKNKKQIILQITNGHNIIYTLREMYTTYAIVFLVSMMVNVLLIPSILIIVIILFTLLIAMMLSYYFAYRQVDKLMGEL